MTTISLKSILGSSILVFLASCSPKVYTALQWQTNNVVVDGQSKDWQNPLRFYDPASKLSYELTNDSDNVYVAFSTKERSTIKKIMRKGLKFSIDTALGKGKYPIQFRFPYRNNNDMNPFFEDGFAHNDSMPRHHFSDSTNRHAPNDSTHHRRRQTADGKPWQPMLKVLVKGVNTKTADSLLAIPNQYGLEVAVTRDSQMVFCEMKIPFKMFYRNRITTSDTTNPLFFQVNLDAIEDNNSRHPRQPEGFEGSGGGRGGFGGHGGGMGGGRSGMSGGGRSGMGGGGRSGGGEGIPSEGNAYVTTQNNANVIRFQFRPGLPAVPLQK